MVPRFQLTMVDPINRLVAALDLCRPIISHSADLLADSDFLTKTQGLSDLESTNGIWHSWGYSMITQRLVLRIAEVFKDEFNINLFDPKFLLDHSAVDAVIHQIFLKPEFYIKFNGTICPERAKLCWQHLKSNANVDKGTLERLNFIRSLWTTEFYHVSENRRNNKNKIAARLQAYIADTIRHIIKDATILPLPAFLTQHPWLAVLPLVQGELINAAITAHKEVQRKLGHEDREKLADELKETLLKADKILREVEYEVTQPDAKNINIAYSLRVFQLQRENKQQYLRLKEAHKDFRKLFDDRKWAETNSDTIVITNWAARVATNDAFTLRLHRARVSLNAVKKAANHWFSFDLRVEQAEKPLLSNKDRSEIMGEEFHPSPDISNNSRFPDIREVMVDLYPVELFAQIKCETAAGCATDFVRWMETLRSLARNEMKEFSTVLQELIGTKDDIGQQAPEIVEKLDAIMSADAVFKKSFIPCGFIYNNGCACMQPRVMGCAFCAKHVDIPMVKLVNHDQAKINHTKPFFITVNNVNHRLCKAECEHGALPRQYEYADTITRQNIDPVIVGDEYRNVLYKVFSIRWNIITTKKLKQL